MLTAAQIRQSFLDFFKSKQHTIVASASLMPDSPNLLFTNAGMNQFVPIFLGQIECPYRPGRAADTQKCIRAGGKHNDLDDVGLDTYHHTFFEMLGNWSFGDYFKKEAIGWAWELIIEVWKFPAERVYATIYQPDKAKGDPADRDQEAWELWAEKFRGVGLDPEIHIVNGNKKDNFWMMGDTGPCGPCTEIHVDLTPGAVRTDEARQRAGALLVNGPDARCIEIWNNVFIQYNANPDGSFVPLPAQHVDTGMGFERVVSIIHGTENFTTFEYSDRISNYDTDVFRPLFAEIEKLTEQAGAPKQYRSTLPAAGSTGSTEQEKIDIAFRVVADHIRTLGFAIADGIQPGNSDRNYVLRRILRRAVKYGRTLGFTEPFFYKLADTLAAHMGEVFPEIRARKEFVKQTLKTEEEAFNRTLDKGIQLFEHEATALREAAGAGGAPGIISGAFAFRLYDEQGFPLDLTELMARERGLGVDKEGFEVLMSQQRERARAAQKKSVIKLSEIETKEATQFRGYEVEETESTVLEVVTVGDKTAVILDVTPCYAEMGGQLGDSGLLLAGAEVLPITHTQKSGNTFLHYLGAEDVTLVAGAAVTVRVDRARRAAISRHHSVTHLLHWALHEVVSVEATQKGSYVGPEKLTFDFNSAALSAQQVADIERLVNQRIVEDAVVSWSEVAYAEVKSRPEIMQAFGEKYGETVRVVQVGGQAGALNGYSMELCGGTHIRRTGEIGLFKIVSEAATGAGIRRIEALAGGPAYEQAAADAARLKQLASKIGAPLPDLEKKLESLLEQTKALEKALKSAQQREAANRAKELLGLAQGSVLVANLGEVEGDYALAVSDALKSLFDGVVVLGSSGGGNVALIATVSKDHQARVQAGKIMQAIAPMVGGKGGGKADFARGGGKEVSGLEAALEAARGLAAG